jgi:transposase InsO family protein
MPWKEATKVSLRLEFVKSALEDDVNMRALCRRYGISPTTGYKWLDRYLREGITGLENRSRRPHTSPHRTPEEMEQRVLAVRDKHPDWGGRKISRRLRNLGVLGAPPPSTITEILRRHGRLDPEESRKHRPYKRFEAEKPNDLWQMDFKGHFALNDGGRCHPLTILDDHSRFCIGLRACGNEQRATVKEQLRAIFRSYGLPERLLVDNGPPWGTGFTGRFTRLGVWLVRAGVTVVHTGHYRPQTIGKDERFHRTLGSEVISRQVIQDLPHAQRCFDPWRDVYNYERPHEAIELEVPASRYRKSPRPFPETLPPVVYNRHDIVRNVGSNGRISYRNRLFRVGKALRGQPVVLKPTENDGILDVYFISQKITQIDLGNPVDRS